MFTLPVALTLGLACKHVEVTVSPTPGSDLSAIVSWQTPGDVEAWVEFGEGALTHRTTAVSTGADHALVVLGMKAERTYALQAVWDDDGKERRSDLLEYTTGELPYDWLVGDVDVLDEDAMQPGWTLVNTHVGTITPVVAAMYDTDGEPVWIYTGGDDGRADLQLTLVDDTVLMGPGVPAGEAVRRVALDGTTVWEGFTQAGERDQIGLVAGQYHNVLEWLGDDEIATVKAIEYDDALADVVEIHDLDGNLVWSWDFTDHVDFSDEQPSFNMWWTHANSVSQREGKVYVNSWSLERQFCIDRASGELDWTLGGNADFNVAGLAADVFTGPAHSFEALGGDRFLAYDNGSTQRGSRAVEYALDLDAMTAEVAWAYPGDFSDAETWYNQSQGDADRLDNGNTLISAGNAGAGEDASRLLEVTPDGELAWRFWFHASEEALAGAYQVERIPAFSEPL